MAYYDEDNNIQPQPQAVQYQQQYQGQYQQQYNQANNYVETGHSPVQIMVFGIVSLSVSVIFGWTIILGILSIVFGALAMSWANKFGGANPGVDNGQVKAGRITGIIGLIFGIINCVIGLFIWIFVGFAAMVTYL